MLCDVINFISSHSACYVASLTLYEASKWCLTLLSACELLRRNILVLWIPFFGKKNTLLFPCKKAVTWPCKIEISYMSWQPILYGQRWEKRISAVLAWVRNISWPRLSPEGCTLVVLSLMYMVLKWRHCYVKVTSPCNIASQRIQKLPGAYFSNKNAEFNGAQEK